MRTAYSSLSPDLPSRPRGRVRRLLFDILSGVVNDISAQEGWRLNLLASLLARHIAKHSRVETSDGGEDVITVLGFSYERFQDDFITLGKSKRFRIRASPTSSLQAINALFPLRPLVKAGSTYSYYNDSNEVRLEARTRLDRLARAILVRLKERYGIDCIVSPTAHYEYQVPWAAAADSVGMPFIALHKEFTVVPRAQLEARKKTLRENGLRFPGTCVLVTNNRAVELFHDAGVIDRSRMIVTGLPRMDRLYNRAKTGPSGPRQVVLFSFGHYSGGLGSRVAGGPRLFSKDTDYGFVELFDKVHGAMGELALQFPGVKFTIKPKYQAEWWSAEIDAAIKRATGKSLEEIPNCEIVATPAVELIEQSIATIGINSTVLLEALILSKPVIVPLFAEASGRHSEFVYLREEMDAFFAASSVSEMKQGIERLINGDALCAPVPRSRVEEIISEYLGFADGCSAERVAKAIVETVANGCRKSEQTLHSSGRVGADPSSRIRR